MEDKITQEKLKKYFKITEEAYEKAVKTKIADKVSNLESYRVDFLDMIKRYISDAKHFKSKDDLVNAFAALNYAHGWLDAGARLGLWDVHDNRLFTVD
ncbi:MAG: DUF357 domain-containing protein [Nanoarchaeota archaeon]|nr:DUF357 domain-containing protein [Nanoarchaeota archaeon]MBU4242557.1 DUF357 domain-containing protein [Nanoarchaeota archaeon]MBU4352538.1 DUF357 domain-containing protein [Nanoarchaeota archaeon]MBU4456891.1 DUF357 domain-containing protein [Nanoarchaeota archaeon]MCG2719838.1 DUF357 domain-containing protein [Nanoarchaeota archaeon]